MNRLTKRLATGTAVSKLSQRRNTPLGTQEIIDKLAAYEDAEEQGLLARLPCKVGDRVFSSNYPRNCRGDRITQIKMNRGGIHFKTWWGYFHLSDFGKIVFRTKEEAEQALKEVQE